MILEMTWVCRGRKDREVICPNAFKNESWGGEGVA